MRPQAPVIANQRGSVLVLAILILAVATIIGVAAITSSTTERQTATNFLLYERSFYAAETGLEHMKEVLRNGLRDPSNLNSLAISGKADWTFILRGTAEPPAKPAATESRYEGGIIFIRSEATGPQNARCRIEASFDANAVLNSLSGYTAQEGSGSGKNFTSNDANAVDLTQLKVQVRTTG